jgi:tRNA (Thr-GGU) A37 N-methylase
MRKTIVCNKPYKKGPEVLGIFATRSDYRPNPLGLTVCQVNKVDVKKGVIELCFIDAEDSSPVIDIKPYHPGVERVKKVSTPQWCSHWPQWYEDMGNFDWAGEFNFPIS